MKLKLRASARFLSSIFAGIGTSVRKDGLATYVDFNYTGFAQSALVADPANTYSLVWNSQTGLFTLTLLSTIASTKSVKTLIGTGSTASPYAAQPADEVLIVKQTAGAPFTVTVDWAGRTKPLRIVDGKGDALANNITITPAAGQTQLASVNYSYVIDSNGGSITLTPLPDGTGAY